MDCFHLELAIKAQVAHPTPRRAIKKWVLLLGTLNAVVIGICPFHKCRMNFAYTAAMILYGPSGIGSDPMRVLAQMPFR